ncbi:hypothetical protein DFS34DRAFT_513357 [Phlyctochytrium arcticum]|nr:hypothetical protein DFS34DRAFT_513357 [Phlyctochytrium arcticum]
MSGAKCFGYQRRRPSSGRRVGRGKTKNVHRVLSLNPGRRAQAENTLTQQAIHAIRGIGHEDRYNVSGNGQSTATECLDADIAISECWRSTEAKCQWIVVVTSNSNDNADNDKTKCYYMCFRPLEGGRVASACLQIANLPASQPAPNRPSNRPDQYLDFPTTTTYDWGSGETGPGTSHSAMQVEIYLKLDRHGGEVAAIVQTRG